MSAELDAQSRARPGERTRAQPDEIGLPHPVETGSRRDSPGLGRSLSLLAWQVRYEQRALWRNRRRALASFAFPLMFLIVFGSLIGSRTLKIEGRQVAYINFYVPGMIAYAVMVIGFTNTAMSIALLRSEGVLKRMRSTPMPWPLYLGGIVLSTVLTIVVASVLLLLIGALFYGARVRAAALPALVVTIALGTICFTSLGIAVSRLIPKPDSGMPVLMFIVLPLSFVSDIFFPLGGRSFLVQIGKVFPLRPLAKGIAPTFEQLHGSGFVGNDLLTLLIWTAVGCWLMVRMMRTLSAKD
ncbi:MAG: ABC transporter permease [Solirubrobacteraceae bacterium]